MSFNSQIYGRSIHVVMERHESSAYLAVILTIGRLKFVGLSCPSMDQPGTNPESAAWLKIYLDNAVIRSTSAQTTQDHKGLLS